MHRRAKESSKLVGKRKTASTLKRTGSTGDGLLTSSSKTTASGKPSVTVSASHSSNSVSTTSTTPTGSTVRKRPSKLRASRERRQRERSFDEDDLDHKFSNLSFNAPAFVPATSRTGLAGGGGAMAPTVSSAQRQRPTRTSAASKASPTSMSSTLKSSNKSTRSLAFVTDRNRLDNAVQTTTNAAGLPPKISTPLNSLAVAWQPQQSGNTNINSTPSPREKNANVVTRNSVERRPRRQRIGSMGFSKTSATSEIAGRKRQPNTPTSSSSSFGTATPRLQLQRQQNDKATGEDGKISQRQRSYSAGSDSDYSSDDEVYPEELTSAGSAFTDKLSLFSQQKRIPKRVSRDVVIDTIFAALFTKKENHDGPRRFSAFGDEDTGTDNDEPNEEFVKRGLAASLFKDNLGGPIQFTKHGHETQEEAVERFITPKFVHTLVMEMRFEDFRTASARSDILRAIHKNCPGKRLHIARALADATALRLEYVKALTFKAQTLSIEKNKAIVDNKNDHGHGFTELLHYAIEHVGESLNGFPAHRGSPSSSVVLSDADAKEILRNYMSSLMSLWKAHWLDPAGSDEEELISSAGQFVAYLPDVMADLLRRILAAWPTKYPSQEVTAIRMLARVIMSGPPLHKIDPDAQLSVKIFTRLAKSVRSLHAQVAQEALAFTGCQFVMVHFLAEYPKIYHVITEAFHANSVGHWHENVRTMSEENFDRALDYAS